MKGIVTKLLTLATVTLCAAAAHAQQPTSQSKFDEVMARGHLIMGTSSEAPPFGYIDEKGELVGFDVDIGKLLAKAIFGDEKKIEFFKQGFAARWANTQTGKIDFGAQVTTIYPDRALKVGFTRGYVDSGITFVVRKESPIKSIADLDSDSVTVANLTVPVQADRAKKYFPKAKVVTFDTTAAQFTALKTNRADAAQLDIGQALWYVKQNPEMRVIEEWITPPTNNALFLKMDDPKWWLVLDTIVSEMRGGSLYNEYAEIYKKWFGVRPAHMLHYVEAQLKAAEDRAGKK